MWDCCGAGVEGLRNPTGREFFVPDRTLIEIKLLNQHKRPQTTPADGRPHIGLGRSIKFTPWGGQTGHHGDYVCGGSSVDARRNYCSMEESQTLQGQEEYRLNSFYLHRSHHRPIKLNCSKG